MKGGFIWYLLLLVLGFMFSATDASRNSGWMKIQVALPHIHFQDEVSTADKKNIPNDMSATRRLDLEYTDYDGTGANDRHDPKSPERA